MYLMISWKSPGDSSRDLFGMVKTWPFQGVVRDLQLGDEKGTLNHLASNIREILYKSAAIR